VRIKITQAAVERAPLAPGGSATYTDTELRGFMLLVGRTSRRYYAQTLVNGRQVRVKVGDHPTLTAKEAREAARQKLASMRAGTNPNEEKRRARARGITLRQALDMHLGAKERSAKTEEGYRYQAEQYLSDWLDRPLCEIGADRAGVRERHRRITERHGRATADYSMRVLRAVYNRGMREHPDLPPNPCANVDFHGTRRRRVEAGPERLREWGRAVLKLSPVMRDLQLFMLLTGMRRTASVEARIEHFDEERGCLLVPNPKGGESRAFDLPLSGPLIELVRRRIEENRIVYPDSPWLFPSDSASGHVAEVRVDALGGLVGHALRHLYATLALEAGVPIAELKFLLNHAVSSGGVTMGYLHPSLDHLRRWQENATARIFLVIGLVCTQGHWPPWLA
jgi:integrase